MAVGKILKTLVKGGKRLRKPISVKENLGRSVAGDVIAPSKKALKGDLGGKVVKEKNPKPVVEEPKPELKDGN